MFKAKISRRTNATNGIINYEIADDNKKVGRKIEMVYLYTDFKTNTQDLELKRINTSGIFTFRSSESWSIDVFASTSNTPSARITM